MKRIVSIVLIILFLSSSTAFSEGLLPSLTDTFGVDMPSMSVYLEREPDEETVDDTGAVNQMFYQVTENDFDGFNRYLEENGCFLADYSVSESTVTETIEKQGKTFTFSYDNSSLNAVLNYPVDTNPGKFELDISEDSVISIQSGQFVFSPEAIIKHSIHHEEPEDLTIGELVYFGRYEQDNNFENGPEEILWRILDIHGDKALLFAETALDYLPFEDTEKSALWESCSLRRWLNLNFYNLAFNPEERTCVLEATISNPPNPKYGTYSGKDTTDHIFLLSAEEFDCYWKDHYVFKVSDLVFSKQEDAQEESWSCWLRTTGAVNSTVMDSIKNRYGKEIYRKDNVCPAMWVTLNNSVMRNAKDEFYYLRFGTYEQDNNIVNGKEEIEWIVLAQEGNKVLLISRYALACQPYDANYKRWNPSSQEVSWETCTLRKWLNESFLNSAFSSDEKNQIIITNVNADKNPEYDTDPGKSTQDQVFLPSIQEMTMYLSSELVSFCFPTAKARAEGCNAYNGFFCWWWLRTPGYKSTTAANIDPRGLLISGGSSVDFNVVGVRPLMWIDLGE